MLRVDSLLFIHGLITLRHEFTKGDGVLWTEPRQSDTERHLVTRLVRVRFLQALFQRTENRFLALRGSFQSQRGKFITTKAGKNVGTPECVLQRKYEPRGRKGKHILKKSVRNKADRRVSEAKPLIQDGIGSTARACFPVTMRSRYRFGPAHGCSRVQCPLMSPRFKRNSWH